MGRCDFGCGNWSCFYSESSFLVLLSDLLLAYQGVDFTMPKHGNLIVCESSLDAIMVISQGVIIAIVIVDIFVVGSETLAVIRKMPSLEGFQIILSSLIH